MNKQVKFFATQLFLQLLCDTKSYLLYCIQARNMDGGKRFQFFLFSAELTLTLLGLWSNHRQILAFF
jgi:hypothetical protein